MSRPLTNRLKAWRLTQRVYDDKLRSWRTMRVADAARAYGCPYNTWDAWEKDEGEPGHRKPDDANSKKLFLFTGGAIRPDHFHPIDEWRAELAVVKQIADVDGAAPLAARTGGGRERGAAPALAGGT